MQEVLLILGPILALASSVIVGVLVYRRGSKADKIAEQAGIATTNVTSIGQVVDGLNKVIINVQSDNADLRTRVISLQETVDEIRARLDKVEAGNVDLRAKNRELERENLTLHAENDSLRVEILGLKKRIEELEKGNGPTLTK